MARNRLRRFQAPVRFPGAALLVGLVLTANPSLASPAPKRVVSLSVCVDEILIRIADRAQIASLTKQAANPGYATISDQVAGIYLNNGRAEDVARLQPDLVLSDSFNARTTIHLLRRMRVRVATIPYAATAQAIRRNIRSVARLIGRKRQGQELIDRFDRSLETARKKSDRKPAGILLYQARGFVPGKGTLADAAIRDAGLANAAVQVGVTSVQQISLEQLVVARPQAIVFLRSIRNAPSMARASFRHPALRLLKKRSLLASMPSNLLICGGPAYADAVTLLSGIRQRLQTRKTSSEDRAE